MSTEYIEIPTCPVCKGRHRYKLSVERAIVLKMMTMADLSERPRVVKVTRLFTCPARNDEFQASFTLTDTSSDRIKSVDVAGISDDNRST